MALTAPFVGHGVDELLAVSQDVAARKQGFLLALPKLRALQLRDLVAQRVHAARLLRLVHSERLDLALRRVHRAVQLAVSGKAVVHAPEPVEIRKVLRFVEQRRPLVLSVDVQKRRSDRLKLRDRDRSSVRAADILAVGGQLALQQERSVRLGRHAVFRERGYLRVHAVERGADERLGRARADQVARGALAQYRAERVDHDGFARAGFAGKRVEAACKLDVRALDDGDILNVQQLQHGRT